MMLAFFVSFFNVTAAAAFPPWFSVPVLVSFGMILSGERWTRNRVILAILIGLFLAFIYPRVMNLVL